MSVHLKKHLCFRAELLQLFVILLKCITSFVSPSTISLFLLLLLLVLVLLLLLLLLMLLLLLVAMLGLLRPCPHRSCYWLCCCCCCWC